MLAQVADLRETKQAGKAASYINLADSPASVCVDRQSIPELHTQSLPQAPTHINIADSPASVCVDRPSISQLHTQSLPQLHTEIAQCNTSSSASHNFVAGCDQDASTCVHDNINMDDANLMNEMSESSLLSPVGQWNVHPWAHSTFRNQPPDLDYSTCEKLSSGHEWQAADTIHFTTLAWLMAEAHPGVPDVMHTSTHTPFKAAGWTATEGRSSYVWSKPIMSALQKLWSGDRWRNVMQSAVNFKDFATDILNDKSYILQELYDVVYIQGTVPWSSWWHLSASTPLRVCGGSGIVVQEPTTNVRVHPLIGTHGGIFNSGLDGSVVQVSDNVGRPYRMIPTDFDVIGLCMATEPKGTHFVTAGIINIQRASASIQQCKYFVQQYTRKDQLPEFKVLMLDSLDKTSPPGVLSCLLQTCGLVSANGSLTSGVHNAGAYYFTSSSVSMRHMRDLYISHLNTLKQVNMSTCALHAACNLQRLVCACRLQSDAMKVGMVVHWYPHPESWIAQCVAPRQGADKPLIVGSYPVEVVCTFLWLRTVIKQKLEILPNGTSSLLYTKICDSISRMMNGAPVRLDSLIYKDIAARVKVYKTSMCTQFDDDADQQYDETTKYVL
jgi:hypothetical protein